MSSKFGTRKRVLTAATALALSTLVSMGSVAVAGVIIDGSGTVPGDSTHSVAAGTIVTDDLVFDSTDNAIDIVFTNAGTINQTGAKGITRASGDTGGLEIVNAGTITTGTKGIKLLNSSGGSLVITQQGSGAITTALITGQSANDTIEVSSSLITSSGAITLNGGVDTVRLLNAGALTAGGLDTGAGDDLIDLQGSGLLTVTAGGLDTGAGADNITLSGSGGLTITAGGLNTGADNDTVTLSGTGDIIVGDVGFDLGAGDDTVALSGGDITITAADFILGTGDNALTVDSGVLSFVTSGNITGDVGNDIITVNDSGTITLVLGNIDLGDGDNSIISNAATNGITLTAGDIVFGVGNSTIQVTDAASIDLVEGSITFDAGDNTLDISGAGNVLVGSDAAAGAQTITFGATGDDTITLSSAGNLTIGQLTTVGSAIDLAEGNDTITLSDAGSITVNGNGATAGALTGGFGSTDLETKVITLSGAGGLIVRGGVDFGAASGVGALDEKQAVNITLSGEGADFIVGNAEEAGAAVAVKLSEGDDNITISNTGNFTIASTEATTNNLILGAGDDTITLSGDGGLTLGEATQATAGKIDLGIGSDTITVSGAGGITVTGVAATAQVTDEDSLVGYFVAGVDETKAITLTGDGFINLVGAVDLSGGVEPAEDKVNINISGAEDFTVNGVDGVELGASDDTISITDAGNFLIATTTAAATSALTLGDGVNTITLSGTGNLEIGDATQVAIATAGIIGEGGVDTITVSGDGNIDLKFGGVTLTSVINLGAEADVIELTGAGNIYTGNTAAGYNLVNLDAGDDTFRIAGAGRVYATDTLDTGNVELGAGANIFAVATDLTIGGAEDALITRVTANGGSAILQIENDATVTIDEDIADASTALGTPVGIVSDVTGIKFDSADAKAILTVEQAVAGIVASGDNSGELVVGYDTGVATATGTAVTTVIELNNGTTSATLAKATEVVTGDSAAATQIAVDGLKTLTVGAGQVVWSKEAVVAKSDLGTVNLESDAKFVTNAAGTSVLQNDFTGATGSQIIVVGPKAILTGTGTGVELVLDEVDGIMLEIQNEFAGSNIVFGVNAPTDANDFSREVKFTENASLGNSAVSITGDKATTLGEDIDTVTFDTSMKFIGSITDVDNINVAGNGAFSGDIATVASSNILTSVANIDDSIIYGKANNINVVYLTADNNVDATGVVSAVSDEFNLTTLNVGTSASDGAVLIVDDALSVTDANLYGGIAVTKGGTVNVANALQVEGSNSFLGYLVDTVDNYATGSFNLKTDVAGDNETADSIAFSTTNTAANLNFVLAQEEDSSKPLLAEAVTIDLVGVDTALTADLKAKIIQQSNLIVKEGALFGATLQVSSDDKTIQAVILPSELNVLDLSQQVNFSAQEQEVANYLNTAAKGVLTGNLYSITKTLLGYSDVESQATLIQALTPTVNQLLVNTQVDNVNVIANAATNRVRNLFSSNGVATGDDGLSNHAWGQVIYNSSEQDKVDKISGYESDSFGAVIGYDRVVYEEGDSSVALGLLVGATRTDSDSKKNNGVASKTDVSTVDTVNFGLYGAYEKGALRANVLVQYSNLDIESTRYVSTFQADGDTKGDAYTVSLSGEYDLVPKETYYVTLDGHLRYTNLSVDSYNETGSIGNAGMAVNYDDSNAFTVGLGAEIGTDIETAKAVITPYAKLGIGGYFVDAETANVAFLADTSTIFALQAPDASAFTYNAGVGIDVDFTDQLYLNTDYTFDARSDFTSHTFSGRVGYRF